MRYLSFLILSVFLISCASVPGGSSVDLATAEDLLRQAASIIEEDRRPLAAEELIVEAMLMCETAEDDICSARSYKLYAEFLQSPRLSRFQGKLQESGFQSPEITFGTRYWHALDYWERALDAYRDGKRYDGMRASQYNIALLYDVQLDNKQKACDFYKKSYASHVVFRLDYPEIPADVPEGYRDYEEYIRYVLKDSGCLDS